MSIKALKTAITIMTVLIFAGVILLFYGIWAKSSELANKEADEINLDLDTACAYQLSTATERELFFVSEKAGCPLLSVSKQSGTLLARYKIN